MIRNGLICNLISLAIYYSLLIIIIKKYSVLLGVLISFILLFIATSVYPGGSMFDHNSVGFDWNKNFISSLFAAKALNGSENYSRIWACLGMIILPFSYAIFFTRMSKKIPDKNVAVILKYGGILNVLCMFLIITPLHDFFEKIWTNNQ